MSRSAKQCGSKPDKGVEKLKISAKGSKKRCIRPFASDPYAPEKEDLRGFVKSQADVCA